MQLLKKIFNKEIFNNGKKPKVKKDHDKLKHQAISKMNYALHKNNADMFISALKEFFSNFYHIKYEFTLEELLGVIGGKKIKQDLKAKLSSLIAELNEIYYSTEKMPKENLKQFNSEIKTIIMGL